MRNPKWPYRSDLTGLPSRTTTKSLSNFSPLDLPLSLSVYRDIWSIKRNKLGRQELWTHFIGVCDHHSFSVTLSFPWPSSFVIHLKINTHLLPQSSVSGMYHLAPAVNDVWLSLVEHKLGKWGFLNSCTVLFVVDLTSVWTSCTVLFSGHSFGISTVILLS